MYISYSYLTRYYRSTTGQTSANWLFNTIKTIGDANPAIVVTQFSHTASGFNQASVIARIPGTSAATSKHFYIYIYISWREWYKFSNCSNTVVLGAHFDSVGSTAAGRAPGADDNCSGTVSLKSRPFGDASF